MNNGAEEVPWREVWRCTALAYGLTWAYWGLCIGLASDGGPLTSLGSRLADPWPIVIFAGDFGPLLAVVLIGRLFSRGGSGVVVGWRRPARWYALAVLGPAGLFALLALINHLTGLGRFAGPGEASLATYALGLIVQAVFVSLFVFGEEYCWRGYLLPRLLPLGEVRASLVLGLIWAFWHLPLLLIGLNYPGQHPALAVLVFTACVLALTQLFTRLFVAASGSVAVVTVFHGFSNSFGGGATGREVVPEGNPLLVSEGGVTATALFLVLALGLHLLRRR